MKLEDCFRCKERPSIYYKELLVQCDSCGLSIGYPLANKGHDLSDWRLKALLTNLWNDIPNREIKYAEK